MSETEKLQSENQTETENRETETRTENKEEAKAEGSAENQTEAGAEKQSGAENKKHPLPEVTFSTFVLSIASSALVSLGEVPDPQTGKTNPDIMAAKHTIDVMGMLKEKTAGNLSPEEDRLLDDILYELRMKYVKNS